MVKPVLLTFLSVSPVSASFGLLLYFGKKQIFVFLLEWLND